MSKAKRNSRLPAHPHSSSQTTYSSGLYQEFRPSTYRRSEPVPTRTLDASRPVPLDTTVHSLILLGDLLHWPSIWPSFPSSFPIVPTVHPSYYLSFLPTDSHSFSYLLGLLCLFSAIERCSIIQLRLAPPVPLPSPTDASCTCSLQANNELY